MTRGDPVIRSGVSVAVSGRWSRMIERMTIPPDPFELDIDLTPEPSTYTAMLCQTLLDATESSVDLSEEIRRRYDDLDPTTVQLVDADEQPISQNATNAALLRITSNLDDALTAYRVALARMQEVQEDARKLWPAPGSGA